MSLTSMLDTTLDRSVLGYTRIGPSLRRRSWPRDPEPGAMRGRTVLVTGATSGLGEETAAGLAALGAVVHVHGHDPDHLEDALTRLRGRLPDGDFVGELCDLSDLSAVRAFADDLSDRVPQLHALVHNAGTMSPERRETEQGHEFTLATMVLGPHLLTDRLTGPLSAGKAIVVFMSSGGMYAAGLKADDPEFTEDSYSGPKAYARVKRMQVVLAEMWAERLERDHVQVSSMHPGWVDTPGVRAYLPKFRALTRPFMRSAAQGADTMIWLVSTRPETEGSARFWHDRRPRPTSYGPARDRDPHDRVRLWNYVADATDTGRWPTAPRTV
ncbi:SDR family NAD(P)-dependent oxidoreductase [Nocardioides sp. YIM 152315]|uniref:SDR family NAD(P)-dependent oxidoreductase n=1 Tax=Nocardioides sp. YIM 152315 TaxID=3031760 RepID=UPI0023DBED82|nr:SDR family NAD(P)-dependent oxidoreductase [Nocardioides sp. YIM 152315]MDF1606081.1 SDR family NAD(P)-dependent oxidoreductase [Nocardioides sp. YIM 152315]